MKGCEIPFSVILSKTLSENITPVHSCDVCGGFREMMTKMSSCSRDPKAHKGNGIYGGCMPVPSTDLEGSVILPQVGENLGSVGDH